MLDASQTVPATKFTVLHHDSFSSLSRIWIFMRVFMERVIETGTIKGIIRAPLTSLAGPQGLQPSFVLGFSWRTASKIAPLEFQNAHLAPH